MSDIVNKALNVCLSVCVCVCAVCSVITLQLWQLTMCLVRVMSALSRPISSCYHVVGLSSLQLSYAAVRLFHGIFAVINFVLVGNGAYMSFGEWYATCHCAELACYCLPICDQDISRYTVVNLSVFPLLTSEIYLLL